MNSPLPPGRENGLLSQETPLTGSCWLTNPLPTPTPPSYTALPLSLQPSDASSNP